MQKNDNKFMVHACLYSPDLVQVNRQKKTYISNIKNVHAERSGSVIECLTRDGGFKPHCGVSLSKTH